MSGHFFDESQNETNVSLPRVPAGRSGRGGRKPQRSIHVAIALVALALVAVVVGIWRTWNPGQQPPVTATPTMMVSSVTSASSATPTTPRASSATPTTPRASSPSHPVAPSAADDRYWSDGSIGQGFYFRSPTGNFECAMGMDGTVGCQATVPVTGSGCDVDAQQGTVTITFSTSEPSPLTACSPEQVFHPVTDTTPSTPRASNVLGYGDNLELAGNTCQSRQSGVSCFSSDEQGFTIASRGITIPHAR